MTTKLTIDPTLQSYIEQELLPNTSISAALFWQTLTNILAKFSPINQQLLVNRDTLQAQIDVYLSAHKDNFKAAHYQQFLQEIGYIEAPIEDFKICPENVDAQISKISAPQLVVPLDNARYAINAINARFGNLYDALYGTDVIDKSAQLAPSGELNIMRANEVFDWTNQFLDEVLPIKDASHRDVVGFIQKDKTLNVILNNGNHTTLKSPKSWLGFNKNNTELNELVFIHHNLHIILQIDLADNIGRLHPAGIKAILLESALTTILDLEDSVAIVDAKDKVSAYYNLFHIIAGDLTAQFNKQGRVINRKLNTDYCYKDKNNQALSLSTRSVILVRNVGIHMQTTMIKDSHNKPIYEGILDALVSAVMASYALDKLAKKSFYVVKPKLHGSAEVSFMVDLFSAIEQALNLPLNTIKLGIMDEERRTSVNLKQCIAAAKKRIIFINTGFLDRTGDEIHTMMRVGAVTPKTNIKQHKWYQAYESRNVIIALKAGFLGQAQIGKGMWAMPDNMAQMLADKITHLQQGANCAWVPSPTAATLHASHYHRYNVFNKQTQLLQDAKILTDNYLIDELLTLPLLAENLSTAQIQAELNNNIQSLLGYVVHWVDSGVGCSKVPDINAIGLMEDRATLRISSQHISNWLMHGICTKQQIEHSLIQMAKIVDKQNQNSLKYTAIHTSPNSVALAAARALIYQGIEQANGYTEFILSQHRLLVKNNHLGGSNESFN